MKENKAGRFFDTVADITSLMMAFLYVSYVALLIIFDLGTEWLNVTMLLITVAYVIFFVIKIFSLNRILAQKKLQRIARISLRYSKWTMKIINAIFVLLSIAATQVTNNHVIAMVGIFVMGFSFLVSVLWDVIVFVARRKLRELKIGWDNLSDHEKNKRIQGFISDAVRSLDDITGLDVTHSVAMGAKRLQGRERQA